MTTRTPNKTPAVLNWEPGVMTFHGQVFTHNGRFFRAKYAFKTMDGAPPENDKTFWEEVN